MKNCSVPAKSKQQGFLIPLTIFIVVVMGMFALVLSRNTIQTSNATTLEMVTVQSFYAAESGAYRAMNTLFFPSAGSRNGVDTRCAAINITHTFNVNGLKNCTALVTCTCVYADNTACSAGTAGNYSVAAPEVKLSSFYKVRSVGTCGSTILRSVRTVETSAMMRQE